MIFALILVDTRLFRSVLLNILNTCAYKNVSTSDSSIRFINHDLICSLYDNLIADFCFIYDNLQSFLQLYAFFLRNYLLLSKVLHQSQTLSKLRMQFWNILSDDCESVRSFSRTAVKHDLIALNLVFDSLCKQIDFLINVTCHSLLEISCIVFKLVSQWIHLPGKFLFKLFTLNLECIQLYFCLFLKFWFELIFWTFLLKLSILQIFNLLLYLSDWLLYFYLC